MQSVGEHTPIRQGTRPSTMDYVFTDEINLVDNVEYQPPIGKSDHVCLTWNLTVEKLNQLEAASGNKIYFWKGDLTT